MSMIFLFAMLTIFYLFLIVWLILGFYKVEVFNTETLNPSITFSIVIPFRNETENLPELLASIEALQYPKSHYEIIFVDDDSQDNSVKIIKTFTSSFPENFQVVNNKRVSVSPKKDAIATAIKKAKYDWIITTDADCVLPKLWLNTFNNFIQQKQCKMVVAPVTYYNINTFLKRFQLLDFLSLIGATIGGFGIGKPFMCNGANLAYRKDLFLSLNGFKGNNNIASGDDIFLLEKAVKQNKNDVCFLKSEKAIVKTKAQPTVQTLIAQRKRWAAKTSSYNSIFGKCVGLIVLLMNSTIVITLLMVILGLFNLKAFLIIFFFKCVVDYMLLNATAHFFNQLKYLSTFFISSLIYPFFSVFIACISMFSKYQWKGRSFNK